MSAIMDEKMKKAIGYGGRRLVALAAAVLVAGLGGCNSLTSPNENFGDLDDLVNNPTPGGVNSAIQGLMIGQRVYVAFAASDVVGQLGILGRESYTLDQNDPRFESEMLGGPLSAASAAFGGNHWSEPYANVRLGNLALNALDQLGVGEYPNADKEWARGFIKTMNALDFLTIVLTRDENCGCPIETPADPAEPAPAVGKDAVYGHVIALLEEANTHLAATDGPPPFRLSSGFAGFDDAASFRTFNRALRARVAAYREDWSGVLAALAGSFVDEGGDMTAGVYHTFSVQPGDALNGLFEAGESPNLRAHPSIKTDAEPQVDGMTPDARYVDKTRPVTSRAFQMLCTNQSRYPVCDVGLARYPAPTSPVPVIRNEELLLLRAEANIHLGDLGAATADLNVVRAVSGKLPPAVLTSVGQAIDQLLYERRYSLFFEGGHRWIDMRRYGRLGELPLDLPSHTVPERYPIPIEETSAGGG